MLPENFCIRCTDINDKYWKKYIDWINKKNKGIVLLGHCLWAYYCNDAYIMFPEFINNNKYELITLKEFFEMKKEFIPKIGEKYIFFNDEENQYDEIYIGKTKNGLYVSYEEKDDWDPTAWLHCKPIPETLELTLEQIAEKFNVSVDKLKIKK